VLDVNEVLEDHEEGAEMCRKEEYVCLRQEMENNRKYIFERPIAIVGATLLWIKPGDAALLSLGLDFGAAVMLFNLWFTANRIRSNARIVGYLAAFHEGRGGEVGWERYLARYRASKHIRHNRFYPVILWFHLLCCWAMLAVASFSVYRAAEGAAVALPRELVLGVTLLSGLVVAVLSVVVMCIHWPRKIRKALVGEMRHARRVERASREALARTKSCAA